VLATATIEGRLLRAGSAAVLPCRGGTGAAVLPQLALVPCVCRPGGVICVIVETRHGSDLEAETSSLGCQRGDDGKSPANGRLTTAREPEKGKKDNKLGRVSPPGRAMIRTKNDDGHGDYHGSRPAASIHP
jgi:hypothetical protein